MRTSSKEIANRFSSYLWAHSPKNWIVKSTYFRDILYVSITVDESCKPIRRSFSVKQLTLIRIDISDLALDCISEIKSSIGIK